MKRALLIFLAGCGGDEGSEPVDAGVGPDADFCTRVPLEIRAFSGETVSGNQRTCSGSQFWCADSGEPQVELPLCGTTLSLQVADDNFAGSLTIHLQINDGQVIDAFAVGARGSGVGHFNPASGWIMPEETDLSGRLRGRYQLTVVADVVSGTYDVEATP